MLKIGDKFKIIGFNCGKRAEQRLSHMGIIRGKEATIESIQPIHGPVTIKVGNTTISIGRGLFEKIKYELKEAKK